MIKETSLKDVEISRWGLSDNNGAAHYNLHSYVQVDLEQESLTPRVQIWFTNISRMVENFRGVNFSQIAQILQF